MNGKKWLSTALCVVLALSMTACGSKENAVYVQNVGELMRVGGIAPGDRFPGLVISEHVTEIKKDGEKTIAELKVKEGDDVQEGQELFSYDTEELQLNLDKQMLELEQLKASIINYTEQIKDLEREKKSASAEAKLQYTIQIQTTQVSLKEAQINLKTKENEVNKALEILDNAVVKAPVAGRIQSINEDGTDQQGKPLAYIVIQQAGAYRVKGTLNELQRGGIMEGDQLLIVSRTDPSQTWHGTVSRVDYDSPIKDDESSMMMMGNSNEMTSTSKYPFYVALDSTEGLLLGQHVYLELDIGQGKESKPGLDSSFVAFEEDGSAYVWAEKNGKLEKRSITVGELNQEKMTYEILSGLTEEDYIAFPNPEICVPGAATTHEYVAPEMETGPVEGMDNMPMEEPMDMPMEEPMDAPMDMPMDETSAEIPETAATEVPTEAVTEEKGPVA